MAGGERRRRLRRARGVAGPGAGGAATNGDAQRAEADSAAQRADGSRAVAAARRADADRAAQRADALPADGAAQRADARRADGAAQRADAQRADLDGAASAAQQADARRADPDSAARRADARRVDGAAQRADLDGRHDPTGADAHRAGERAHRPSPADLAELPGPFALTAAVHDPEPEIHHEHRYDDPSTERGLRGLVGGGSSQVSVTAAMRARDASRPDDELLTAAEASLPIVRRGWVPREELPRPGHRT
jgi:hypothetical protein